MTEMLGLPIWEGLVKDGVNLNPADKQSLRLAAGPPVGPASQQQLIQPSSAIGQHSHTAAAAAAVPSHVETTSHSHDSDADSDNEHNVPSRSVSKGPPKKGTRDELVTRYPIAVSAKDAKGISETIRQLTERLCTKRQNVLQHDTKWTDLKKSEVVTSITQELAKAYPDTKTHRFHTKLVCFKIKGAIHRATKSLRKKKGLTQTGQNICKAKKRSLGLSVDISSHTSGAPSHASQQQQQQDLSLPSRSGLQQAQQQQTEQQQKQQQPAALQVRHCQLQQHQIIAEALVSQTQSESLPNSNGEQQASTSDVSGHLGNTTAKASSF
ncbi:TPA: hypothetical protein ACH3X1_003900 [Trebouxia sp. C0004]